MSRRGRISKGGVQKRGGAHRARITIHGKTFTRSHPTRQQAENWIIGMENGVRDPEFAVAIAEARTLTLGAAMMAYLKSPKKTTDHYQKDLSRTNKVILEGSKIEGLNLFKRPLFSINTLHIQLYIDHRLEQDVSPSTINRELNFMSRAFTFAASDLKCIGLANPVVKSVRLPEPPGRERRLRKDEEVLLFRFAAQYEVSSSAPLRAFISFAADTAMRFGEIMNMRWDDIDWEFDIIDIPKTKNGSRRSVPMVPEVRDLLERMNPQRHGWVWPASEQIRSAWRRVREQAANHAAKVERDADLSDRLLTLRIHDLRHEGVSRWVERTDFSMFDLMLITGHKSPTMLLRYTHANGRLLARRLLEYQQKKLGEGRGRGSPFAGVDTQYELPIELVQRSAWKLLAKDSRALTCMSGSMTMTEIAQFFGVSVSAVAKILNKKVPEEDLHPQQPRGMVSVSALVAAANDAFYDRIG